jgi:hypothetical protein
MTVKDHEPVYARNCWYVAGWSDEISEGQPYSISILGEPIVFFVEMTEKSLRWKIVVFTATLRFPWGVARTGNCVACITASCLMRQDR